MEEWFVEHRAFKKILAELVNELTAGRVETLNKALAAREFRWRHRLL